MNFAHHLTTRRKELGMSVEELAKKIGIARSYVTHMENNKRLPGKKLLPKFARVLKVNKEVIIEWYLETIREKIKSYS